MRAQKIDDGHWWEMNGEEGKDGGGRAEVSVCGRIWPTGRADWPHWPLANKVSSHDSVKLWCGLVPRKREKDLRLASSLWFTHFYADLSQAVHSFLSRSPSRQSKWPFDPEQSNVELAQRKVLRECWRPRPDAFYPDWVEHLRCPALGYVPVTTAGHSPSK